VDAAARPARAQQVTRLRVQVPADGPLAWREPAHWRQRVEDALRCGPLAGGRRVLLLRRLRVRTSAAAAQAGGAAWQAQVDQACRDAAARACHALDPAAAQADALWFEDWDEAVAACLDMLLALAPASRAPAWLWPRLLALAGLQGPAVTHGLAQAPARQTAAAPAPGSAMLARALWQRWQADPASARAGRQWLRARPQATSRLGLAQTEAEAEAGSTAMAAPADLVEALRAAADAVAAPAARNGRGLAPQDLPPTLARARATGQRAAPPEPGRRASPEEAVVDEPAATARRGVAAQPAEAPAAPASLAAAAQPQTPAPREALPSPTAPSTVARAPTRTLSATSSEQRGVVPTRLAGLPLTINALERLGFATAWQVLADAAPDAATRALAGSSPWLWAWARLPAPARAQALADPMWRALPVAEWWPAPEAGDWWARWRAAPPQVQALGQRAWHALAAAARRGQDPTPRRLLLRHGGMALSATHLDVVFRLDDADLAVRRLGLDQDPGWVPWFGRIVQLHFQPTLHGGAPQ
jgi:hypothetical protein